MAGNQDPNNGGPADIRDTFKDIFSRIADPTYWMKQNHIKGASTLRFFISKLDKNGTPFSIHLEVAVGGYQCNFFTFYSHGIKATTTSPQLAADDPRLVKLRDLMELVAINADRGFQATILRINQTAGISISFSGAVQSLDRTLGVIKQGIQDSALDAVAVAFDGADGDGGENSGDVEQNQNQNTSGVAGQENQNAAGDSSQENQNASAGGQGAGSSGGQSGDGPSDSKKPKTDSD